MWQLTDLPAPPLLLSLLSLPLPQRSLSFCHVYSWDLFGHPFYSDIPSSRMITQVLPVFEFITTNVRYFSCFLIALFSSFFQLSFLLFFFSSTWSAIIHAEMAWVWVCARTCMNYCKMHTWARVHLLQRARAEEKQRKACHCWVVLDNTQSPLGRKVKAAELKCLLPLPGLPAFLRCFWRVSTSPAVALLDFKAAVERAGNCAPHWGGVSWTQLQLAMPRHVPARALSMACASASTLFSCLSDLHDAQVRFFAAPENMTLVDILRKHVRKVFFVLECGVNLSPLPLSLSLSL